MTIKCQTIFLHISTVLRHIKKQKMVRSSLVFACFVCTFAKRYNDPCDMIYEGMRFAGFMVRDCSYFDPYVYWRIEHLMTWDAARSACQQIAGGELVSIHNFDEKRMVNALSENNFVSENEKINRFDQGTWIGLRNFGESNEWRWSDGTFFGYQDWLSNQPDNGTGKDHCVHVIAISGSKNSPLSVGWNDLSCSFTLKPICKTPRLMILPMGK